MCWPVLTAAFALQSHLVAETLEPGAVNDSCAREGVTAGAHLFRPSASGPDNIHPLNVVRNDHLDHKWVHFLPFAYYVYFLALFVSMSMVRPKLAKAPFIRKNQGSS